MFFFSGLEGYSTESVHGGVTHQSDVVVQGEGTQGGIVPLGLSSARKLLIWGLGGGLEPLGHWSRFLACNG